MTMPDTPATLRATVERVVAEWTRRYTTLHEPIVAKLVDALVTALEERDANPT